MDPQTQANASLEVTPEIQQFLEDLVAEAGLGEMDERVKAEMMQGLYTRLDNFMASVILENLSPEDAEVFIRMNEEKKPKEETEQFLKNKVPNSDQVFAKALVDFRDFYLGNKSNEGSANDQSVPASQS